jgi:hypothetical protein
MTKSSVTQNALEIKLEGQFQHSESERSDSQGTGKISQNAGRSREWEKFRKFHRDRRLTDCVELLEKQGFSGDSAIFMLTLAGGEP